MRLTTLFGLWAAVATLDGAAAKNDKKKKGELSEASFVLIGDSTTNNNTVTPNCKYSEREHRESSNDILA